MADLILTKTNKLDDKTRIVGNTEAGTEWIDAWNHPSLVVIDSGVIVIPHEIVPVLKAEVEHVGLTVEEM